jgi:hypothetical protein
MMVYICQQLEARKPHTGDRRGYARVHMRRERPTSMSAPISWQYSGFIDASTKEQSIHMLPDIPKKVLLRVLYV